MKHNIMVTTTVLAVYLANNRAAAYPYEKADLPADKPSLAFTRPKISKMDVHRLDARRMDLRRTDHERGENRQNKIQTKDVRKMDVRRMDLRRMEVGRKDVSNLDARRNDKQTIDVITRHVGRMNIRRKTMDVRKGYTQIKDVREMKSHRKNVTTMNIEKSNIQAKEFEKTTIELTENPKLQELEFPVKELQIKINKPLDVQITGVPKIYSHGKGVQKQVILKIDEQKKDVKPWSNKSQKNAVRSRNVREKDVITYSNILQTIKRHNFAKASHQRKDFLIINKPIIDCRKKYDKDMYPPAIDFPTIDLGLRRDETVGVLRNDDQTVDIPTMGTRVYDVPGVDVARLNVRRNIDQAVDQKRNSLITDFPAVEVATMGVLRNLGLQTMDLPSIEHRSDIPAMNIALKNHVQTMDDPSINDFPIMNVPTTRIRSYDISAIDYQNNNALKFDFVKLNNQNNIGKALKVQTKNVPKRDYQMSDLPAIDVRKNNDSITDVRTMYILKNPVHTMDLPSTEDQKTNVPIMNAVLKDHVQTIDAEKTDFPVKDYLTMNARSKNNSTKDVTWNNVSRVAAPTTNGLRNVVQTVNTWPIIDQRKDVPAIDAVRNHSLLTDVKQRNDFPIIDYPTIDTRSKNISLIYNVKNNVSMMDFLTFSSLRNLVKAVKKIPKKELRKDFPLIDDLKIYIQTVNMPRTHDFPIMEVPTVDDRSKDISKKDAYRSQVSANHVLQNHVQPNKFKPVKDIRKVFSTYGQTIKLPRNNNIPKIDVRNQDLSTMGRSNVLIEDILRNLLQTINLPEIENQRKHDTTMDLQTLDVLRKYDFPILQVPMIERQSKDVSTCDAQRNNVFMTEALKNSIQTMNFPSKEDPRKDFPIMNDLKNHVQAINVQQRNKMEVLTKDHSSKAILTTVDRNQNDLQMDIPRDFVQGINYQQIENPSKKRLGTAVQKKHCQAVSDPQIKNISEIQVPKINDQSKDARNSRTAVFRKNVSLDDVLKFYFKTMNPPQASDFTIMDVPNIYDQSKDRSILENDVQNNNYLIEDTVQDLFQTMNDSQKTEFPKMNIPKIYDQRSQDISASIKDVKKENVSIIDVLRDLVQTMIIPPIKELLKTDAIRNAVPRRNDFTRKDVPTIHGFSRDSSTTVDVKNNVSRKDVLKNIVEAINGSHRNDVPRIDFPTIDDQNKDISRIDIQRDNVSSINDPRNLVQPIDSASTHDKKKDFSTANVQTMSVPQVEPVEEPVDNQSKDIFTLDFRKTNVSIKDVLKEVVKSINVPTTDNQKNDFYRMDVQILDHKTINISTTDVPKVPKINIQNRNVHKMDFSSTDVSPADGLTGSTLAEAPDPVRFFTILEAPALSQRKPPLGVGWLKGIKPTIEENVNANKNQENMDKFMLGDDWVKSSPQSTEENEIANKSHEDMDASSFIAWLSGLSKSTITKSTDAAQTRNYELTRLRRVPPFEVHWLTDRYKSTTESKETRQNSDSKMQIKTFGLGCLSTMDQPESTTEADGINNKFQFKHESPPTTNIPIMTDENVLKKDFEELQKIPLTIVWLDQRKKPAAHVPTTAMPANELKIAFDKYITQPLFSVAELMRGGLPRNADHIKGLLTARPRRGPRKNERVLRDTNTAESDRHEIKNCNKFFE